MKDFFDVWLLSRYFNFEGAILAKAISATFAQRDTPIEGESEIFSSRFAEDASKNTQWRAFLGRSRLLDAPQDLGEVIAALTVFLGPVAQALSQGRSFKKKWNAPGPWSPA
jgi:hypothetical protein